MPCNCDHLEPTEYEIQSRIACRNLKYILEAQEKPVPPMVEAGAKYAYGAPAIIEEVTVALRAECRQLDNKAKDEIIYDGKSQKARALADWWEAHQDADRIRAAKEQTEREREALVANALSKLNRKEIEALRQSKF